MTTDITTKTTLALLPIRSPILRVTAMHLTLLSMHNEGAVDAASRIDIQWYYTGSIRLDHFFQHVVGIGGRDRNQTGAFPVFRIVRLS